jgi:hypothetical protein
MAATLPELFIRLTAWKPLVNKFERSKVAFFLPVIKDENTLDIFQIYCPDTITLS